MSTIHDALKKIENTPQAQRPNPIRREAQAPLNNPFNPPSGRPQEKNTAPAQDPKNTKKKKFPIRPALLLLCLILVASYVLPRAGIGLPDPGSFLPFLRRDRQKAPTAVAIPVRAPRRTSGPDLQGIISSGGRNTALIDNMIYEIGESLNKMTITDISRTTVTLVGGDGEEHVLRLSR